VTDSKNFNKTEHRALRAASLRHLSFFVKLTINCHVTSASGSHFLHENYK